MSLKRKTLNHVNRLIGLLNAEVTSKTELQILRSRYGGRIGHTFADKPVPVAALEYLRPENPRLAELRQKYRQVTLPVIDHSKWTPDMVSHDVDLRYFRGDNAYVFQYRDFNTDSDYLLSAYHLKSLDRLNLFTKLKEDELFGVYAFPFDNDTLISRDLLDSIAEIQFLEETLKLSERRGWNVLDIGAGYGRFAHRMTTAFGRNVNVYCTDAVPESTFLSEFYLRFRGVNDRAHVVPLHELENTLANQRIDLATNIHSFSECTLATVTGWLDVVRKHAVKYLMIIPNAEENCGLQLITLEKDHRRINYLPEIEARGYKLLKTRPKFTVPSVQQHGVSPTHYYLFELQK
jgi:putative sugar O-methyltransferase